MKTMTTLALVLLTATSAFAQGAPPAPAGTVYTIDADGDGYGDATAGAVALTAATRPAGYSATADDCDDGNAQINPKARERLDDNVDNDCDGRELQSPPAGVLRAFGCSPSNHSAVVLLITEMDRCAAAAPNCRVNLTAGKFETTSGFHFMRKTCADPARSVVDQTEKARLDDLHARGAFCKGTKGKGGSRKGSGSKAPARVPSARLTELDGKVTDLSGKVTGLEGEVGELKGRVGAVETVVADNTTAITGLGETLNGLGKRVDTLESRADAGDVKFGEISGRLVDNETATAAADEKSDAALSTSRLALATDVSANLNVGVGVKPQADVPLKSGGVARGSVATVLLLTGEVGAELPTGIYRIGGGVGVPYETGPNGSMEPGILWTVNAKALWKLAPSSKHALGVVARYLDQESGGNVRGAEAYSRGGGGGLAYEFSPGPDDSWLRFPFQVTLEGGGEEVSGNGKGPAEARGYGLLTFSVGAGVGPALR